MKMKIECEKKEIKKKKFFFIYFKSKKKKRSYFRINNRPRFFFLNWLFKREKESFFQITKIKWFWDKKNFFFFFSLVSSLNNNHLSFYLSVIFTYHAKRERIVFLFINPSKIIIIISNFIKICYLFFIIFAS